MNTFFGNRQIGILCMGALLTASLVGCSSADEAADAPDNKSEGLRLFITASMPQGGDSKAISRGGTYVDDAHADGLTFKWTESSDKMVAILIPAGEQVYKWTIGSYDSDFCHIKVKPHTDNFRLADMTSVETFISDIGVMQSNSSPLYCIQNATDISASKDEVSHNLQCTAQLSMPKNNLFKQTEKNATGHLTDYLFLKGITNIPAGTVSANNSISVDASFYPAVATIRFKITNRRPANATIKSVKMKSQEKMFIDKKIWTMQVNLSEEKVSEYEDKTSYTNVVTALFGDSGFEVAKDETIYNYVSVHQHDDADAFDGKTLDFILEDSEGHTYTAYNFDCIKLNEITGNADFVARYTYTFNLSLRDKLTVTGIEVANQDGNALPGWSSEEEL